MILLQITIPTFSDFIKNIQQHNYPIKTLN